MSLKIKCGSKWNVTQSGMSLKMECHSKWNVTQNGMSLKMDITQNCVSLKMECHSQIQRTQMASTSILTPRQIQCTLLTLAFSIYLEWGVGPGWPVMT